jgi:hypothetical protein
MAGRTNKRISAISWLTRGKAVYREGEGFLCEKCRVAYEPEVLDLAHRVPVRKDRSGRFQSTTFAEELLALPLAEARAKAHVLCANCHRRETAKQRKAGWVQARA